MRLVLILSTLAVLVTPPAGACSVRASAPDAPKPGQVAWVLGSVYGAHAIVRARAERVDSSYAAPFPLNRFAVGVSFRVLDVVAADSVPPASFTFPGRLSDKDEFPQGPVPYLWPSRDGPNGACYAYNYRLGGEYLFMLSKLNGEWTSQTTPDAPLNEQIRGATDPWVEWVRAERAKRPPR
jgi:hypothetical protein